MESLARFAGDNVTIIGSSIVLVFLLLVFAWYRRRTSSVASDIGDDLLLEETQNRIKKPAKARSRKGKSDKGVQDEQATTKASQPIPNGHVNKVQAKVTVSANKPVQSVSQSGSAKVDTSKQTKAVSKKQPKSTENLAELSGEWTVAVSKKKPRAKKEPSPQKDEELLEPVVKSGDLHEAIDELKIETLDAQSQIKPEVQSEEPDVAVSYDELPVRGDSNPDLLTDLEPTVVSAKWEDVNDMKHDAVDALAVDSQDGSSNMQKINKKKKKKNKNKAANIADVVDSGFNKQSEATENDGVSDNGGGQIPSTSVSNARDTSNLQSGISPPTPDPTPAPVVTEVSPSHDAIPVQSSSLQGVVFDELGDEPSMTVPEGKKKRKPRRDI